MLDYTALLARYPWILQRNMDCILSPDSDGLLCGLFMSHYLGWRIRGFYDGKVLMVSQDVDAEKCVFLDMEIFRAGVRSVGQHMVMFNKKKIPPNWGNFDNCISANNLRGYDVKNDFKNKYPFATIHLLIAMLSQRMEIVIPKDAVCLLLYTDGVFKNIFNYPENSLSWLEFLQTKDQGTPLGQIFFNDHYSISTLMHALKGLFDGFAQLNGGKRGGDKIKISDANGQIVGYDLVGKRLDDKTRTKTENLLQLLARQTGWNYVSDRWACEGVIAKQLEKESITNRTGALRCAHGTQSALTRDDENIAHRVHHRGTTLTIAAVRSLSPLLFVAPKCRSTPERCRYRYISSRDSSRQPSLFRSPQKDQGRCHPQGRNIE